MAIKAVNNTISLNRLISTLLVYRAYLKISNLNPPALFIINRIVIIQKVIAEIVKLQTKQTINNTLYYYNRLNITLVYNLPLNSKVFIQCKSNNQTRLYCLLAIKEEIYNIQLFNRLTSFRTISVKLYFRSETINNDKPDKLKASLPILKLTLELIKPIKPIIPPFIKRG